MIQLRSILVCLACAGAALAEPPATPDLPPGAVARLGSFHNRFVANLRYATFTKDGSSVLSCGSDGSFRLWDATSGRVTKEWKGIPGHAVHFQLSPDGKRMATSDGNGTVQVVDLETGQAVWSTKTQRYGDLTIEWVADGKQVLVATQQGMVQLFDAGGGDMVKSAQIGPANRYQVHRIAVAPDGKLVAVSGFDGTNGGQSLLTWDIENGKEGVKYESADRSANAYSGSATALAYSPDGKWLAASMPGLPGGVTLWDTKTGKVARRLGAAEPVGPRPGVGPGISYSTGPTYHAMKMVFSSNGRFLAAGGADGKVRIYGIASGQELRVLDCHRSNVEYMAFSPDDRRLLVAGNGQVLQLWDLAGGQELNAGPGHRGPVLGLLFFRDGKRLVTAGNDGTMRLWDALGGKELLPPANHAVYNGMLALGDDGESVCYANGSFAFLRWKPGQPNSLTLPPGNVGYSLSIMAPDGKTAAAPVANAVRVVDANGKDIRSFSCQTYPQHISLSPGARYVAASDSNNNEYPLHIWSLTTGDQARMPERESAGRLYPYKIMFSPDARLLAVVQSGAQNHVNIYESASGAIRTSFVLPQALSLTGLTFSPDGRTLALGLVDGSLQLADIPSGAIVNCPTAHRGQINVLVFSPDGALLATGSADTTAVVWDLAKLRRELPGRAAGKPAPEQLEAWARDLATTDGERANSAVWALSALGEAALPYLGEHRATVPAAKPSQEQLSQWIKELDDDRFAVRKRAERFLALAGEEAKPGLTAALEQAAPDVRRQIEILLKNLSDVTLSARLRPLRSAEVLERIGGQAARDVLESWRKNTDDPEIKAEIDGALERMSGKK
jgi:WD40 repeat protein